MKKYFFTLIAFTFLAACSSAPGAGDKKAQLEKLKQEQQSLNDKIQKLESETKGSDSSASSGPAKEVSVTAITPKPFTHFISTQALVQSDKNIDVVPQAQGVYRAILVKEGQKVSKGQALARIDDLLLQRNLSLLQTQLSLKKTLYDKRKKLWDQNIGTEVDFLQAKNDYENFLGQIASVRQQIAQATVTSPISGTVDQVNARLGEAASPAIPAFRVVNTDELKVTAALAENYLGRVKKGTSLILQFDDLNLNLKSHVDFVGNTLDMNARTFVVQTKLRHVAGLKPNMTAVMKIQDFTTASALVLPVDVVQSTLDGSFVYVAVTGSNNQVIAKKKTVKVGLAEGGQVQITEGLTAGDKVITTGYRGLEDGQSIKTGV